MTTATKFADHGTQISVLTYDDNHVTDTLRPAVYAVGFNPMAGFFLTKRGGTLTVPDRVYGSVSRKVDKVLTSFQLATRSFGVLLTGDKGSGKTMTSSLVANRCIEELSLPVILIDEGFDGAGLSEFIEKIGECVLFFDEFAKKFQDQSDQMALLGLFDGTSSSRRLVMLTENESRRINQYMLERPGRAHYHFRHDKLEEDIVREYCADRNIDESVIEQICFRREISMEFSFDVLQAIVREYELFGGTISDICNDLNIERPLDRSFTAIEIIRVYDAKNQTDRKVIKERSQLDFPGSHTDTEIMLESISSPGSRDYIRLSVKNIVKKDGEVYTFSATTDENESVVITGRRVQRNFDDLAF